MKPEVADESAEDTFDLPIPPDFPLPDAAFSFPECRVSSSALELLDLVKKSLDQQYISMLCLAGEEGAGIRLCLKSTHCRPAVSHGGKTNLAYFEDVKLFYIVCLTRSEMCSHCGVQ